MVNLDLTMIEVVLFYKVVTRLWKIILTIKIKYDKM